MTEIIVDFPSPVFICAKTPLSFGDKRINKIGIYCTYLRRFLSSILLALSITAKASGKNSFLLIEDKVLLDFAQSLIFFLLYMLIG